MVNLERQQAAKGMASPSGHVRVSLDHDEHGYTVTATRETHFLRWGFFPAVRHETIAKDVTPDLRKAEMWFEQSVELLV